MSHKLTKDELDEQFELFLKESLSDESVDFCSADKQSGSKSTQHSARKHTVSWWQDEEDSDGGKETATRRFIKVKKLQPENKDVVSVEPVYKPVPKPRSKLVERTQNDRQLETPQSVHEAMHETSIEKPKTDSMSSPTECASGEEGPDKHSGDTTSTSSDCLSQGDDDDGRLGSGTTSSRHLRRSQPIQEEDEDLGDGGSKENFSEAEAVSMARVGLDMLGVDEEEEVEKTGFFAQLEAEATSTIDYSLLNRELDSTSSTIGCSRRKAVEPGETSDDDQKKGRDSPGSEHYSDDFEDEENEKVMDKGPTIPAKGSLSDSMDDPKARLKVTAESLEKGQSNLQSGGSEMDALHDAYRQIHVLEDSEECDLHSSSQEWKERINRHATQTLHPASTNESELPTAEELMRPIRPEEDHIRGFSMKSVSPVQLEKEMIHSPSKRTLPVVTSPESHQKEPETATGSARPPSRHTDQLHLTWKVSEGLEKRTQGHKHSPSPSSRGGSANKQRVFRGSAVAHSSNLPAKKPTVTAGTGKRAKGKTPISSRLTGPRGTSAKSTVPRELESPAHRATAAENLGKDDVISSDSGLKVSSELVASVQSLVTVLQQQMHGSSGQDANDSKEAWGPQETTVIPHMHRDKDVFLVDELKVQLAQKERELQEMKCNAEELSSLRQHNYLLQSKLNSAEEVIQRRRLPETTDSAMETKLQQIAKEMKEQEVLIQGYQQENEKLCKEMKAQQLKTKANEADMFNENQRLLNELHFTRDQLNRCSFPVAKPHPTDHARRVADLLTQLKMAQSNEAKLLETICRLEQENRVLEVDIQQLQREQTLAKQQAAAATSGEKTLEMCIMEDKHREEVAELKKKVQWFAENQELLDRDAGRLKAATAEISQLKEHVEKLKTEVGKRSSEQQRKAKQKSLDIKRMQDLERQVKELEQILRSRNPNSLPALIYAAATAGSQESSGKTSTLSSFLEDRIQRLEAELESHDEEAKRSLRTMEQQFHRIKLRYEEQISVLEQKLNQKQQVAAPPPPSGAEKEMSGTTIDGLEEELLHVKEVHQHRERTLLDQIETLQQKLKNKSSPSRLQRQTDEAFGVRISRLNQELSAKTRTIQELHHRLERLGRERRSILPVPKLRQEERSASSKQGGTASVNTDECASEKTFPDAQYEKAYQPTIFEGSHIEEVQQENEALKEQLKQLELQRETERNKLTSGAVQVEEEYLRMKEDLSEQLSSLKAEHLKVLGQLRAHKHSSSEATRLAHELNTHAIMVKHLQEQLKELQGAKEALTVSRAREDALQAQLTKLLKDLQDAKDAQSPEGKLLCNLEKKLINMDLKHQHREKELQQVIGGSWFDADQRSELEHWKHLAQEKSRELEAFRLELDSILDILRHLQRQGVVLPATDHQFFVQKT